MMAADEPDDRVPIDEVFSLLGCRRRLLTVRYLSMFEAGTVIDVRQIARVVRSVELGIRPVDVSTSDYESAYNSLIQGHLSKLDDGGVLDYDSDRKTVRVRPATQQFAFLSSFGEVMLR